MIVSLDQVVAALTERLEDWLPGVVGGGYSDRSKREWMAARRAEGGPGDSLLICMSGPKRGTWCWHALGRGGDALGLVAIVKFGDNMKAAYGWARDYLGGTLQAETDADRERRLRAQRQAAAEAERAAKQNRGAARRIWFHQCTRAGGGSETIAGTPAEAYLAERGISLKALGHVPGSLRFAASLPHPSLDASFPTLVAGAVDLAGELAGVHRTFLVQRNGRWDRVRPEHEGAKGKAGLGTWKGAAVRLWRGERVNPATGEIKRGTGWSQAPDGSSVTLVEGIENGLSLALVMSHRRIAACMSIEHFAFVALPPAFEFLTIAGDNDRGNRQAEAAIAKAVEVHVAAGRQVKLVMPPAGVKDWNDMLRFGAQRAG